MFGTLNTKQNFFKKILRRVLQHLPWKNPVHEHYLILIYADNHSIETIL